MSNALYVYGIVKNGFNFKYSGIGLNGEIIYTLKQGEFSALVHDCEERPYSSEDPEKIKELIIAHNNTLSKALKNFNGVMPLSFNTIIKGGENSAENNLKKWLDDNKERLERAWDKIKNKREYGIRIYYDKNKLIQEASSSVEIKEIEASQEGKSEGLSYLLQGKAKSKMQEIFQESINKRKQEFLEGIKKITCDVVNNPSRISLEEEKDLLLNASVLIEEKEVSKIKGFLEKKMGNFPFQIAGPFAPYSFVEKSEDFQSNETKY